MKFLCVFLILFNAALVVGQTMEPIDCDSTYDIVQEHLTEPLPNDFFIINTTTGISINTNAPAIIGDYAGIRAKYPRNMLVLIVVKDENGIGAQNINRYFEDNFLMDFEKDPYLQVKVNEALYSKLNTSGLLSTTLYFHKGCLYFNENCKWSQVHDHMLPTSSFGLKQLSSSVIDQTQYSQSMINYIAPLNDSLFVCVTDFKCRTHIINAKTGKVSHTLHLEDIDALELYEKFVASNKNEVAFAREADSVLEQINRNSMNLEIAERQGDLIYFTGDIQVMHKIKKPFVYYSDEGRMDTLPKGSEVAPRFGFVMVTDLELDNPVFYFQPKKGYPKKKENQWMEFCPNFGFKITPSGTLLGFNYPNATVLKGVEEDVQVSSLPMLSEWKFTKSNKLKFLHHLGYTHDARLSDFSAEMAKTFIIRSKTGYHLIYDVSKQFHPISPESHRDSLVGSGKPDIPEHFATYALDGDSSIYNYYLLAHSVISPGKHHALVYKHRDEVVLEIRNRNFEVVQTTLISDLAGMDFVLADPFYLETLFFLGNTLTYLTLGDSGAIKINRYRVELNK